MASDGRHDTTDCVAADPQVQFGVERVVPDLGHHDLVERGIGTAEQFDDQVVGHRAWCNDPRQCGVNRGGFGRADEDRVARDAARVALAG